jgi:glycosyltransferase involved in cell wall biosynthesis
VAKAEAFAAKDERFILIRNTERKGQARNTVEIPRRVASSPEDVIVLIDGDDWLLTDKAFTAIRDAYAAGAWLTYGQLVESSGHPTRFGVYPKRIAASGRFADWVWCATPPRSFKRFLLDELNDEDFKVEGTWPKVSGDICVLMPLLQLACERAVGITVPIYSYNIDTPDSDHKTDAYEQTRVRDLLLERPPKTRLVR